MSAGNFFGRRMDAWKSPLRSLRDTPKGNCSIWYSVPKRHCVARLRCVELGHAEKSVGEGLGPLANRH
jgi:hypothetical protein